MKKFINKIFIATLITLFAVSCGNSPTNPSNGGGGGANPTPNEFVDKLKSIGMVKAGEQEWDFRTISQSGNVLTIKPMNNAKSGYLKGLDRYLSRKMDEIEETFKYRIEFNTSDSTASDGSQPNSKANSNPLEAKITFYDKKTDNPITDADFKDGFILKIEANANWAITPEVTAEDYKKSINQLGTINVNGKGGNTFAMDFAGLNVTKDQYNSYTADLTIDANGKTDTIDLLNFIDVINGQISKSKTEYLEISYVSISSENSFYISFNEVSANKVINGNVVLKVKFNGNLSFAKRDLNVTITSTPEIVTDNSGQYKESEFNVSTDAENISFQSTSIVEKTSTGITINNLYASYRKEDGVASITLQGNDILNAHKTLKSGETAEFEITFTASATGYNDKTDVKMTLKIKKGDDLPSVTVEDFNAWLNTIEVSGFTKQVGSAAITLTASSGTTPDTALNSIREALKKLSKDKIVIDDYSINSLEWDRTQSYPTENKDGIIKVRVSQSDNYVFGDELKQLITDQYGSTEFAITVKPQSSWIPDISITGAGSSASNPIRVNVGDGVTATDPIAYTIKLPENMKIDNILYSYLEAIEGINDDWKLGYTGTAQHLIFDNQSSIDTKINPELNIIPQNVKQPIVDNSDIQLNDTQKYKVEITISYGEHYMERTEKIYLYVELVKNHSV
ncbi:hypothetical protein Bint_0422 [Brachyspira intermedia PWS/A]|uniref:Lipoprotein n=1 Tax=Brachyspira intermedia (strain ATCC 51140 / PWS/A) TaxID=1045858 RepID=G0EIX9_BRAIP|nr:hypothetical protein [Brachyspira intermedia]AEM21056.1 hypothetical protein Bint_0422 [Brachyspira intermedia PWS/A]